MSEKEQERIENAQRADTHKVLTLPNLLSFFRILLIPVIIVLYYHAQYVWAFALLLCLMPMKYWWMVGILVTKECSIGILTLIALRRTHSVYSAGWYGKLCTVTIYLSMFVLMLWRDANPTFVLVDAIVCSALIVLSFVLYLVRYTAILRDSKPGKAEKQA